MITRAQREALYHVYLRTTQQPTIRGYRAFRRTATLAPVLPCLMVPFHSMWLGIELDGYTHS